MHLFRPPRGPFLGPFQRSRYALCEAKKGRTGRRFARQNGAAKTVKTVLTVLTVKNVCPMRKKQAATRCARRRKRRKAEVSPGGDQRVQGFVCFACHAPSFLFKNGKVVRFLKGRGTFEKKKSSARLKDPPPKKEEKKEKEKKEKRLA